MSNCSAISVVIPTYNRADLLARALQSVKNQTAPPGQVVVVDDGSTDNTRSRLADYEPWITVVHLPKNQGVSVARNEGVQRAAGDIIAFLDSDDEWRPTYLARINEAWQQEPDAAFVYTHYTRVQDDTGREWDVQPAHPETEQARAMLFGNFVHTSSVFSVQRDLFEQCGGYDPAFRIMEDRLLYMRLLERGPARLVAEPLVRRHIGSDNLINDRPGWWAEGLRVLAALHELPPLSEDPSLASVARLRLWTVIRDHQQSAQSSRKSKPKNGAPRRIVKESDPHWSDTVLDYPDPNIATRLCLLMTLPGGGISIWQRAFRFVRRLGLPYPYLDQADGPADVDRLLQRRTSDRGVFAISASLESFRAPQFPQLLAGPLNSAERHAVLPGWHDPVLQGLVHWSALAQDKSYDFFGIADTLRLIKRAQAKWSDWLQSHHFQITRVYMEDLRDVPAFALKPVMQALDQKTVLTPGLAELAADTEALAPDTALVCRFRREMAARNWPCWID